MRRFLHPTLFSIVLLGGQGCAKPDIVLRPDHHFGRETSITLVCEPASDPAIFKPELEKEMLRRGYNVFSESTAPVIEEERKTGDLSAEVASKDGKTSGVGEGRQLTQKTKAKHLNSEYTGTIQYIYDVGAHEVRRVNFTIVRLSTGAIVASVGYEKGGKNAKIAKQIATKLDLMVRGVKEPNLVDMFTQRDQ